MTLSAPSIQTPMALSGSAHAMVWHIGKTAILPCSRESASTSGLIGAMLRSASNDLWVGTLDGLVRIRGDEQTLFTKAQGLSGNVITSLLEDRNHTLWVGTKDDGLSRSTANGFIAIAPRPSSRNRCDR